MSQSALWTVSATGTWNVLSNTAGTISNTVTSAFSIIDTGALFGVGSDNPGGYALYQFIPNAIGSRGVGYTPGFTTNIAGSTAPAIPQGAGGNYLAVHFATGQTASTGPAAIGAGMYVTPGLGHENFISTGAIQAHTTSFQGCAPFIDLINAGGGVAGTVPSPVAHQVITSTYLPPGNWIAAWSVQISATASSSDANNFNLVLGVSATLASSNAGATGTYPQSDYGPIPLTAGTYLSVTAGAATPTSATTYAAQIFGTQMPTIGNGYTFQPAGFYADATATSEQSPANVSDTAGFTPRHTWVWASVTQDGTTVAQVPAPQASWSGPVTSTLLNGPSGIQQTLAFLNNPPVLRQGAFTAPSIPNVTSTVVSFTDDYSELPVIDTYNAYNSATGAYVTPLPGLYLAFASMPFSGNATGVRYAGFQVNGVNYEGPAYSAVNSASIPTSAVAVRVLDLIAGDTVAPIAYQSSGGSLALTNTNPPGYQPHFGMMYLCPYSSGGVLSFTPPLTSFHWYAGLPADQLLAYMDEHLGNDLNFLVNRPYFTGFQRNAQSGLADGSWNAVTIDTPGGLVHGNLGDNYGGWNAAQNMYVAQQPGWYLVIAEVYGNTPSAATAYMAAGINCPSSGGVNPSTSPDQYQTVYFPVTTGKTYPGALAIGAYYLAVGESVQPMIYANNWGGNYGTGVSGTPSVNSQFSVTWMAE